MTSSNGRKRPGPAATPTRVTGSDRQVEHAPAVDPRVVGSSPAELGDHEHPDWRPPHAQSFALRVGQSPPTPLQEVANRAEYMFDPGDSGTCLLLCEPVCVPRLAGLYPLGVTSGGARDARGDFGRSRESQP